MVTLDADQPPAWAWEFHGHQCPFMPIGYRMGTCALRELGIDRVKDHGAYALVEIGVGHPQTCMADGVMVATGCTYGKLTMERLGYGKMALILYVPDRDAVRVSLRPEFQDELGKQEFFAYRKRGVEPSQIPEGVTQPAIRKVLDAPESSMVKVDRIPGFRFARPKGSFARGRCTRCGEYVFERYLRTQQGQALCIPCSETVQSWSNVLEGVQ